jgi:translation initiation factor IF-1
VARDDLISADGRVIDTTGGSYSIQLDNGAMVTARLSGRMKKFKIRVLVGDRVTVGDSPYDPTHGLITHRQAAGSPPPPRQ